MMRRFYEHVWTCSLTADSPECLLHSIACLHHGRLLREKLFEAIFEFNRILPGNVRKNREHVHIFSHLLSYLSSSTAFYNYHLLQFCISAVRLFSLLRPFSPCFRRAFKACLCYILHHLASPCIILTALTSLIFKSFKCKASKYWISVFVCLFSPFPICCQ